MTVEKVLVTRNEVRKMGVNVSNTTFLRWEKAGLLTPVKPGGVQSSKVYYWVEQVFGLFPSKPRK